MKNRRWITFGLAAVVVALLGAVGPFGCGTSKAFQKAMHEVGPGMADVGQRYIDADGLLASDIRAQRTVSADGMRQATATEEQISGAAVEQAWGDFKPWYGQYVAGDARLNDRERLVRQMKVAEIDKLIAKEKARPLTQLFGAPASP